MPFIRVNGARLFYEEQGKGEEAILFSHGLLMSGDMFHHQVEALSARYRCITYDHRGQARSEVTRTGYDMDSLTVDALALIRELGCNPCHFAGLSMGGFIGMRLAIRHPEVLKSLVLMETSADPEPEENRPAYRKMAFIGRWLGFRPLTGRLMEIMFSQSFLKDPAKAAERERWRQHFLQLNRRGTARAAHAVIDREGVYEQLQTVRTPTLIIVGEEDVATVPAKAERMHAAIRGARLERIAAAGHSASVEQPDRVTSAMERFLPASSEIVLER